MCGIVGYIGTASCQEILLDGLRRLEYRGYDSAGMAIYDGAQTNIVRAEGKLNKLVTALQNTPLPGKVGIGHTRWATHGRPSEENAHPHKAGTVVVVHNGIIENHMALRRELISEGHTFQSETDTEILSHLIEREIKTEKDLAMAVRKALRHVHGSYAIAVHSEHQPDLLVAARLASPLVVGIGNDENFVASDAPAVLSHTRDFIFIEDGDVVALTSTTISITDLEGNSVHRERRQINWSPMMAEKSGYKHFMLKEIHEQPRALTDTLRGRISLERGEVVLDGLSDPLDLWGGIERVVILACGTSWHAGLVGKFWFESHLKIPVEVDLASEFRYRDAIVGVNTLAVAISQSGETADTLAAAGDAKKRGARVLAICNVVESSLSRLADYTVFTHAGPEIGVASTKAFLTQLSMLYLLSVHGGRILGLIDENETRKKLDALIHLPIHIETVLNNSQAIQTAAEALADSSNFLYIGRWINYPIALEGALKLKEISYIHAEGYPAGEMKHGPIALIDEHMPVVAIATRNKIFEKVLSNVQEAKARHCRILSVCTEGDEEMAAEAEWVFTIPAVFEELEPILTVVPLQLLAYYIADYKGTDVDQPRNLAKSVTVE